MRIKVLAVLVLVLSISTGFAFENFDQAFNQMRHRYSLAHYKRVLAIAPYALKLSSTNEQKYKVIYYKGLALDAMFDFWPASQAFEKAANLAGITPKQALQARFNQIESQYSNKLYISALANAEKYSVFKSKPSALHFHILLKGFEAARELNKREKALELARKMVKISPSDSAWHYRGRIMELQTLCQMKKYDQGKKLIKKTNVKKLPEPMRSEFFTWSGFCNEKCKDFKEAGKYYNLAYNKESGYYPGLAALRHANLLSHEKGKLKQSDIELKYAKVLQMPKAHPKHKTQAIYKIARIYQDQNKPEKAMHYLAMADDLINPSTYWQAKIFNMHGDILYKQGKNTMAKKYFQACLKISKDLPDSNTYAREIIAQMEEKKVYPEKQ